MSRTVRADIERQISNARNQINSECAQIGELDISVSKLRTRIEELEAMLAEIDAPSQDENLTERQQALSDRMFGNYDTTGRRKTHSLPEALAVWVWWLGTQTRAAKELGMEKGYFSRLATGKKSNPSDAILKKLWLERTGYGNRYRFTFTPT